MRIAVSGTHCSGKTTLVDEFLRSHPEFAHEPEPYVVLVEDFGEEFSAEPGAEDFYRQLEFNIERLSHHRQDKCVIYDRSPVDFLAYLRALRDIRPRESDSELVETAQRMVFEAVRDLDLIVFLPVDDVNSIDVPDSEYPKLRRAVDSQLVAIFSGDLDITGGPLIVEARGSTAQRLEALEEAIGSVHRLERSDV